MWQKFNTKADRVIMGIVCGGLVDAVCIEDLTVVLGDNMILTLAKGDRMTMTDNLKLTFQVETPVNASPATFSRAGIVFICDTDLDWALVVDARGDPPRSVQQVHGQYTPLNPDHCSDYLNRNTKNVMTVSCAGQASRIFHLLTALLLRDHVTQLSEDPAKLAIQNEKLDDARSNRYFHHELAIVQWCLNAEDRQSECEQ